MAQEIISLWSEYFDDSDVLSLSPLTITHTTPNGSTGIAEYTDTYTYTLDPTDMSGIQRYIDNLLKLGMDVSVSDVITHTSTRLSPLEFSVRTIAALKRYDPLSTGNANASGIITLPLADGVASMNGTGINVNML